MAQFGTRGGKGFWPTVLCWAVSTALRGSSPLFRKTASRPTLHQHPQSQTGKDSLNCLLTQLVSGFQLWDFFIPALVSVKFQKGIIERFHQFWYEIGCLQEIMWHFCWCHGLSVAMACCAPLHSCSFLTATKHTRHVYQHPLPPGMHSFLSKIQIIIRHSSSNLTSKTIHTGEKWSRTGRTLYSLSASLTLRFNGNQMLNVMVCRSDPRKADTWHPLVLYTVGAESTLCTLPMYLPLAADEVVVCSTHRGIPKA